MDKILTYIEENQKHKYEFQRGQSYRFAFMLVSTFGGAIMYDTVDRQFVAKIDDRYYDITGDITFSAHPNESVAFTFPDAKKHYETRFINLDAMKIDG